MSDASPHNPRAAWTHPLALFTAACVIVGALARFWQLGKWPLAIDEYYLARSIQNVLHSGLPQYPCGGLYVRGLLVQYGSAALQLAGLSPELAPRLIAALASLLTLPAAYQIGKRLGGRDVGLLAVAILALSVWEVEIGRFGRMYAPFQALFAWYLVFFLAYAVDGKRRALLPMLLLSALGVWVWEGGIFLVIANLLPPFIATSGRLGRRDWLYLAGVSLLFIPVYPLALTDWLSFHSEPLYPADYGSIPDAVSQSRLDVAVMPITTLSSHRIWLLAGLLPVALLLFACVSIVRTEKRPLAAFGLIGGLVFVALQQFELAAGLLVVLLLLTIIDGRQLAAASARPLHAAVLACVVFWLAFGLGTHGWHTTGMSAFHTLLLLGYEFFRFPDILREVAMPWARTVPLMGLGLFLVIAAACVHACLKPADTPLAERVVLALFVILLFTAGAAHPPRHETRYVFFLYPLAVVIVLTTITRASRAMLGSTRLAAAAATLVCLAAFALSEDFRPKHLWNIASETVNFRIGMSGKLAGHYHPRSDTRAAATWLKDHAVSGQDIVINAFPGVDFYYPEANYYFVADTDPRFEVYSCRRGTVQRWSNLPMIHNFGTLAAKVATGRRVWMVLETERMPRILAEFPTGDWTLEWTSKAHDIAIVSFHEPARS